VTLSTPPFWVVCHLQPGTCRGDSVVNVNTQNHKSSGGLTRCVLVYDNFDPIDPTFRMKINSVVCSRRVFGSRLALLVGRWSVPCPLGPNLSCDTSFRRSPQSAIRQLARPD